MTTETPDRSYRALFNVPTLGRVILAMQVGRIAAAMLPVVLVLFAITVYDSPLLAGAVTFASVFPGIVAAPIVGALLDRYGRIRMIAIDYVVAAASMALIGALSLASALPGYLLVVITLFAGMTSMFSDAGLRSLFARITPAHLWERVNAVDSTGYQLSFIIGPPVAATLFALVGGPATFIVVAVTYGIAALALYGLPEPAAQAVDSGRLLRQAWEGLHYVWRNQTLRGLASSASVTSFTLGVTTVLVPVIVITRLAAPEPIVGLVFAVMGVTGIVAAVRIGRTDTLGRERHLLVVAHLGIALATAVLFLSAGVGDTVSGVAWMVGSMAVLGAATGLWDIALFTVRQRRTDPRLMARAFAISMAVNNSGYPIGAFLGGWLAGVSIEWAIGIALGAAVLGTALAAVMVPARAPDALAGP